MATRTDRIVVAGLPRSGTTYVGRILAHHPDLRMVLEPLNEEFGLRTVSGQFPFVSMNGDTDRDSERLLAQMIDLRGGWRRLPMSRGRNRTAAEKAAKLLVGSRTSWEWRRDALYERMGRPAAAIQCFKDPFATFALDYLVRAHGVRSICMVRHPAAYYQSFVTQPWAFGTSRLINPAAMRRELGEGIDDDLWAAADTDKLAYCAVMWRMMSKMAERFPPDAVLVVRHEDFASDVAGTTEQISSHFGLSMTREMVDFIRSTSTGSSIAPEYLKVHAFVRDSQSISGHWRTTIDPNEEHRLSQLIGSDLHRFYKEW